MKPFSLTPGSVKLFCFTAALTFAWAERQQQEPQIPPGLIQTGIERAAQNGETHVSLTIPEHEHEDFALLLDDVLRKYSVLHVKATGRSHLQIKPDILYTWHTFSLIERLSERPVPSGGCGLEPPRQAVAGPTEVLLPFVQGSVTSQGVTLTVRSRDSSVSFAQNAEYLLIVVSCGNGVFAPRLGPAAVLSVASNGGIQGLFSSKAEFAKQMEGLTVESLRKRIADLR